jgi:hypothetical protein
MAERVRGRKSFSIGSVLSRTFPIWARNIIPFSILSVIVYLPLGIFLFLAAPTAEETDSVLAYVLVYVLLFLALQQVVAGALIYGVFQQLRGERAGIGDCLKAGFARLLPVVAVGVIAGVLVFLGAILLIVPGIILACMYWVAVPVAVVEKPGVIASLRRSAQLTDGERWSVFAILLLLFAIQQGATKIVEAATEQNGGVAAIVTSLVLTMVFGMLSAVASAVGYHDLRVAKEGVGIEDLVKVFE